MIFELINKITSKLNQKIVNYDLTIDEPGDYVTRNGNIAQVFKINESNGELPCEGVVYDSDGSMINVKWQKSGKYLLYPFNSGFDLVKKI